MTKTALVCALMIGRAGSVGFPGKNLHPVLGRPLGEYPLLAARAAKTVDRIYVSTDSPEIMEIARRNGAELIERPKELATKQALGEHAFRHGYEEIARRLAKEDKTVELVALLFANAPTVSGELIDQGVDILRRNPDMDSAVTTSVYNMWSPPRARRLAADGTLQPFIPFEVWASDGEISCDRDSQGDVYYADMGLSVVRPRCLSNLEDGMLPQKWMGRKIAPIPSWGGCDVDAEWQIPQVEFWLKKHGVTPP